MELSQCGCEVGRKGQPLRMLQGDKRGCLKLVPAWSPAQTVLQRPLSFLCGSGWSLKGEFLPLPSRPWGVSGPVGLHPLFTSDAYLFIDNLYPPTSSRVIFAQREHSEVTSC